MASNQDHDQDDDDIMIVDSDTSMLDESVESLPLSSSTIIDEGRNNIFHCNMIVLFFIGCGNNL